MAAVSIPPSPQVPRNMTTRRVPLANVPNATNSPYRPGTAAATKRPRPYAQDQRDTVYGQGPPAKKQIVEENDAEARRNALFRKAGYTQPTALQKKLEAARDAKSSQKPADKSQRVVQDNYETIRQWQRHYRKVFPQYVFYFESIPDDARTKAVRQLLALGAREEKFFSKSVTHVVTTRPIPPEQSASSSADARTISNAVTSPESKGEVRTINPSLLDRTADQYAQRSRLGLDLAAQRKPGAATTQGLFQDVETRKQASNSGDILVKAREMGMKIWALEKLERILTTMFNTDTGEQPHIHNTRGNTALATKTNRGADLSQLLRNEKVNGPADRDLGVATKDMAHFRGYYIYVHCMNEKYRPVIVRDYPRVATKEDGKWPQFRLTGPGRCPFVEDPAHVRKLQMEQQKPSQPKATSTAPRTRAAAAAAAVEAAKQRAPTSKTEERQSLREKNPVLQRQTSATEQSTDMLSKPLDPPKLIPAKRSNTADGMPPLFGSAQASLRATPRFVGGEPVASGVQPSNITSAIRSQMISSTAAAPGARGNTSKELQNLSRKVLEKNSAPNSMNSSYMTDVRAAINGDRAPPTRAAKRKAQETLGQIHEDSEEDENPRRVVVTRRKKPIEKDPKPGYCENCREKFDDFETHTAGRKHRKFALSPENWTELDALLSQLERPVL